MKSRAKTPPKLDLQFSPVQYELLTTEATEIWYGGAMGGGKSHAIRLMSILLCIECPGFMFYLFRRNRQDLIDTHIHGKGGYVDLLGDWIEGGWAQIVDMEVRFWNRSKILLRHCDHENDVQKYKSAQMYGLGLDEGGDFTPSMYRFLRLRNRIPLEYVSTLPRHWQRRLPFMITASNPGGPCHDYLKSGFYDPVAPRQVWRAPEDDGGRLRVFIPAKLTDNEHLDYASYSASIKGIGNEALVKMYLDGDMNVVFCAYFKMFAERHIVEPFTIPDYWTRFRAIDYGFEAPNCCLWMAVSDGTVPGIPKDALIVYREHYVTKLTADVVAREISELSNGENISYSVADPSMVHQKEKKHLHGPTLAEEYAKAGVPVIAAANDRIAGWNQVRTRWVNDQLYIFNTCRNLIRTIPIQQHDKLKPEDLDTKLEDHAVDALRYGCMSRPYTSHEATLPKPPSERFTTDVSGNVTYEFEDDLTTNDEATL